jgi:YidC/Oxa1 family membrane protein insertase
MFFNHPQQQDLRTSADVLKNMHQLNKWCYDITLASDDQVLDGKLTQEVKANTLTQAEADRRGLEGAILTIDAQVKGGEYYKEYNRLQNAWYGADKLLSKYGANPLWKTMAVPVDNPSGTWTGESLYAHVRDSLDAWNRQDLIYGFIPGYQVIDWLVHSTGAKPYFSYWFACFLLALLVRGVIFPLSQKQMMWGRQMGQLSPLLKQLKEKYKKPEDQTELQKQTMNLYKEYGLNPMAGCLPTLIQLPLFLTVYQFMLRYRFAFQNGFFMWMNPNTHVAFLASNLGQQDKALAVVYGITMVTSTLLMPVNDPTQVLQQRLMGVGISLVFTLSLFFGAFPVPAAFILYWTFTNILATAQSLRTYRLPLPPLQKVVAPTGGVYPTRRPSFMERMGAMMQEQMEQQSSKGPNPDQPKPPSGPTNGVAQPDRNTPPKPRSGNPNIRRPKRRK